MASTGEAWRRLVTPVRVAIVALAMLATSGFYAVAREPHEAPGAYLWFVENDTAAKPNVKMIDGIPHMTYDGGRTYEPQPVAVAQWGLEQHARGNTTDVIRAADWLVEHQESDGAWSYGFDFAYDRIALDVKAPWISGMAQGQALSLLVRAWRTSGDERYLAAGRAALHVFDVPVPQGGVLRHWRGLPFYVEYPTEEPIYVLNGFLFALIGLHDFAAVDDDAARLWRAGEVTAARIVRQYDLGGGDSAYCLAFEIPGGPPPLPVSENGYARVHHDLVAEMSRLTGRAVYAQLADEWTA